MAFRLFVVWSFDKQPMPTSLDQASAIPVTMPDGRRARLGDLITPRLPTVISLWASWCGPCQREAPKIIELRDEFGPQRLNLVYLNVREPNVTHGDLASFLNRIGMSPDAYAVMSEENLPRLTNDRRNLIPRTFVFDRAGKPQAMIVGYKPLALNRVAGLIE